jgi:peptidoglycan/LPS O-acetylase OafA/YrhL
MAVQGRAREPRSRPPGVRGHIPGLDGVRGLAILMVMAVHFVGDASPRSGAERLVVKAATFGTLGVDLFFVLSGFLITGLLVDTKQRPKYFRDFYARRTLRIFPLYYATLIGLFVALPALGLSSPYLQRAREHQLWLWTYTANFFIAAKSSWWELTYVNHFWSLAIEEHFYLFWPLVVFGLTGPVLERVCLGVIAAALAGRIALAAHGMSELSISVLTPCRVDVLCVGGLLALLARHPAGPAPLVARARRAIPILMALIVALSAWCAVVKWGVFALHQVRGSLYAVLFGALALTSLDSEGGTLGRMFQSRVLRFFGKYSYGLYVYHGVLTWYLAEHGVEDRLDDLIGSRGLAIAIKTAGATAISVVVSLMSYHYFEKRFLSFKRFFEGQEAIRAVSTPDLGAEQ